MVQSFGFTYHGDWNKYNTLVFKNITASGMIILLMRANPLKQFPILNLIIPEARLTGLLPKSPAF
jgi:hypothetical protein